jgi:hypothetical protein
MQAATKIRNQPLKGRLQTDPRMASPARLMQSPWREIRNKISPVKIFKRPKGGDGTEARIAVPIAANDFGMWLEIADPNPVKSTSRFRKCRPPRSVYPEFNIRPVTRRQINDQQQIHTSSVFARTDDGTNGVDHEFSITHVLRRKSSADPFHELQSIQDWHCDALLQRIFPYLMKTLLGQYSYLLAALLATAAVTTGRKLDKNKPQKPMAAPPMAPPAWTLINKKRPGPKRNPHRRSSVSSCDGSIRIEIIRESKKSEIFSFITAPPKSALDKIQQRQELKTIAEETAAAPQRLQGSKRFVFGTNNSNT